MKTGSEAPARRHAEPTAAGVTASRPNGQAALPWVDPLGFLSGQGAGLGWPLALDEAARVTDHVLRVSRALLDANRAAADAMRDLVRSQQDLAFETCRAGYTALCGQSDDGAAIAWERAAARFGDACGRSIQAMLSLGNPGTEVRDDATSDRPSGAEVRPRGA